MSKLNGQADTECLKEALRIAESADSLTKEGPKTLKDYGASIDFNVALLPHLAALGRAYRAAMELVAAKDAHLVELDVALRAAQRSAYQEGLAVGHAKAWDKVGFICAEFENDSKWALDMLREYAEALARRTQAKETKFDLTGEERR